MSASGDERRRLRSENSLFSLLAVSYKQSQRRTPLQDARAAWSAYSIHNRLPLHTWESIRNYRHNMSLPLHAMTHGTCNLDD